LVALQDAFDQRLPLLFDDFDLLREDAEPLAHAAQMAFRFAIVRGVPPKHSGNPESAQLLERLAHVLDEAVLLALRSELRKLAVDDAQMGFETVELRLDAVDLRSQRLLCHCDCGAHVCCP
jgi:hypothetical protein